jgi:hypothetical protein
MNFSLFPTRYIFRLLMMGAILVGAPVFSCATSESVLFPFSLDSGGAAPNGVIFDRAGNLYGTANGGGNWCGYNSCGMVFELSPAFPQWKLTILHSFSFDDGGSPTGSLIFDSSGNLYGTTEFGGSGCGITGCGVIFELSPSPGGWSESVLYRFSGGMDGSYPPR